MSHDHSSTFFLLIGDLHKAKINVRKHKFTIMLTTKPKIGTMLSSHNHNQAHSLIQTWLKNKSETLIQSISTISSSNTR